MLARTLETFVSHRGIDSVICAIHPDDRPAYDDATSGLAGAKLREPVAGGTTRQASVQRAIEALSSASVPPDALCLVHDAARPFVAERLLDRAIAAGNLHEAAIPGLPVTDTLKRIDEAGLVVETLDRSVMRAVQTPQVFRLGALRDAHGRAVSASETGFTDDGQLMEWAGMPVHVFPGDPANVKLTHPHDFDEAERRLGGGGHALVVRVGTGFDVHAFGDGDHVWLGGLRIPHVRGVLAHSDGDVVLHALTDALLGVVGDGDIGTHFPPSDPRWRGASSDRFLAHAAEAVRKRGGRIDHLDATVLCERPRIGDHREAMRQRIGDIAGVPVGSVSIKATTTERMGFTGREEGLAAQAAATVRLPSS